MCTALQTIYNLKNSVFILRINVSLLNYLSMDIQNLLCLVS